MTVIRFYILSFVIYFNYLLRFFVSILLCFCNIYTCYFLNQYGEYKNNDLRDLRINYTMLILQQESDYYYTSISQRK